MSKTFVQVFRHSLLFEVFCHVVALQLLQAVQWQFWCRSPRHRTVSLALRTLCRLAALEVGRIFGGLGSDDSSKKAKWYKMLDLLKLLNRTIKKKIGESSCLPDLTSKISSQNTLGSFVNSKDGQSWICSMGRLLTRLTSGDSRGSAFQNPRTWE